MKTGLLRSRVLPLSMGILLLTQPMPSTSLAQTALQQGAEMFENHRYDDAILLFEAYIKDNPDDFEGHYNLGKTFILKSKYDEAILCLEKAVRLNERLAPGFLWLGRAYGGKIQTVGILKKASYGKKSMAAYKRAVEIDPKYIEARESIMHVYLIVPAIAGGSIEKARAQADTIRSIDAKAGHLAYARVFEKEKKYKEEEKEILQAAHLDSLDSSVLVRLGQFYFHIQQTEKAFDSFEQALAIDPDDMNAAYQIGRTAALTGHKLERGRDCLLRYLEHGGSNDEGSSLYGAHWRLGMIYEHLKDLPKAVAEYEAALRLNPDDKEIKEALNKLK